MRTFDHQLQLIGLAEGVDDDGFPIEEIKPKDPIFANKLSVRSNEFWQARNTGVQLSYAFEIHSFEYEGEEKALYDGEEYTIERTYSKGDLTEIYLSRKSDEHAYAAGMQSYKDSLEVDADGI